MDPETSRRLVRRLREADPQAFAEVHEAFHARLYGFLARLARSRDVAEDLLEETWLRLVRHAQSLDPDTQLGSWLFTVARNLHVSYRRSRALETGHMDDLIGLWPSASHVPSPFEATAANETTRRLEAALASLPATYREVLLLVGVEGLTPAQAASVCGITPESLRQRLHRARGLLSKRLDRSTEASLKTVNEVLP